MTHKWYKTGHDWTWHGRRQDMTWHDMTLNETWQDTWHVMQHDITYDMTRQKNGQSAVSMLESDRSWNK